MTSEREKETLANEAIRAQFPILSREVNGHPLVYLDNAASSQKPDSVIKSISDYYAFDHSNVHRGVHFLSQLATEKYEAARETMRGYINASEAREIIFTKGCTDGINLVAYSAGRAFLKPGDEILITEMEHHSNIVPWQIAADRTGAKLVVSKVNEDGTLDLADFENKLNKKSKIVSIVHVSNALGTINPVVHLAKAAREAGAWILIDGAQAAPHLQIDVQAIDCDFYVFSGHKMYGPTGSGVLYGKAEILEQIPPYQGGGEMIKTVTFEKTTYNDIPFKFEAGTPDIAAGIGLAEAVRYMQDIGYEKIAYIEQQLLSYGNSRLAEIEGIRFIGTAPEKSGVISFLIDGTHPYDVGAIIDKLGVAVRTGHHCTQPLMDKFGISGTIRASFAVYNTLEEVDVLAESVQRAVKMLRA